MQQYLFFVIYGIFVIVNILDCVTTVRALQNGATELNPVMKKAMNLIGIIPALVIMKIVAIAAVVLAYVFLPPARIWLLIIVSLLCVVYILVVINNYRNANKT